MATHEFLGPALHAALSDALSARGMSFRALAIELEVSPATFTRMAKGARPEIDAAMSMCRWLDRPAEDFVFDRAAADAAAIEVADFALAEPAQTREHATA